MPKHAFPPDEIGKGPRYYDESDNGELQKKEVLHWLTDNELLEAENAQETKRLTEALLKKLKNFEKASTSPKSDLQGLATDFYYSARDLFSGRRIKTSSAIITGILIGAGIGAFLGSWLLPVIGTAIGGVVGGMIVAGVTAIGIFGFTLLGAGLGSWIGSKISNALFKDEKKFQISYRQAKKIKKNLGLGWKDAEMINGYLRNRINAVHEENPEYKNFYSLLRKLVIEAPQEKNLSIAVGFFKNELRLLEKQKALVSTPALEQDIKAVIYILRSFTKKQIKNDVLSSEAKKQLSEFCDHYESGAISPPSTPVNPSSIHSSSSIQSPPPIRIRPPKPSIATTPKKVFNVSQTNIQNLESHFDDAEKYETYNLSSITHPEGSLDRATLIFNNPSTSHQPEVFVENGADHSLYFSTTQGLEDEEFEFVAERAARLSINTAEPNFIIDLTLCASPDRQYVLYRAFMKAKAGASFPEILVDQSVKDRFEKSEKKKKIKLTKN